MKTRYTELKDWINEITLLYEKTLKQSMIDKILNEQEGIELKKSYIIIILIRKNKIMNSTQLRVEGIFGDILSKGTISPEQITKLNEHVAKVM